LSAPRFHCSIPFRYCLAGHTLNLHGAAHLHIAAIRTAV